MAIVIEGLDQARNLVKTLVGNLRNTNSLMQAIEEEIENIVNDSIQRQRSATTGQKYKDLTPLTQKLEKKPATPALTSKSGFARIVRLEIINKKTALIHTSIPYGDLHQFGNPNNKVFGNGKGPIPARQFLPITKDGKWTQKFEKKLEQITLNWIMERLNR